MTFKNITMTAPDAPLPSLDELEARIRKAAPPPEAPPIAKEINSMGVLSRLAFDLLAGVVVGLGIGWGLDSWLGTAPWLMVACFFLGSCAGFLNLKRSAEALDKREV